jgi:2-keto-4-pentenoate hydratase/2-oxohepta-3-ene-1,7-dioic acid hydratase in catechol pathway
MRLANLDGRATLVIGEPGTEVALDIATSSSGRFGPDLAAVYRNWEQVIEWYSQLASDQLVGAIPIDRSRLGPPSPTPAQVFAIGLNYKSHAAESGFAAPTGLPPVFTKYVSSFTGPDSEVVMPAEGNVDWEVELVVVIGREASRINEDDAMSHVAGFTVGQDISERLSQVRGPAPQFGLAKSFPGFSPQGPWLCTLDELNDPDDLELGCSIDGEEVQKSRTRDLIFPVRALIAALSQNATLYPGDVIFTGTPAGVGVGREPQRFLQAGERLDSWIEGIGELHQTFIADTRTK